MEMRAGDGGPGPDLHLSEYQNLQKKIRSVSYQTFIHSIPRLEDGNTSRSKNEIIMVCGVTGRCQKTTSQNVVRYSSREQGGTGGIRGNQEISNNKWRSERRGWTGVIVITSNSDKLAAVT